MSDDVRVYNLGEVRSGARKRAPGKWRALPDSDDEPTRETPPVKPPDETPTAPTTIQPRQPSTHGRALLAVSASLFMPGTGQLVQRRYVAGAAWALVFALLVSALSGAWAILPRLWAAAQALGLPPQASVWLLGILLVSLALVHTANVLSVQWRELPDLPGSANPAGAAAASALIPGWGQLVNGHTFRGGLFVSLGWLVVLSWIFAAPAVHEMLVAYGLHLPRPLSLLALPAMRWALPAALWPLAVYDAGLWAWIGRR